MSNNDPHSESTIRYQKTLQGDGRLLFARRRSLRSRLLEFTVPSVWLLAAGFAALVYWW